MPKPMIRFHVLNRKSFYAATLGLIALMSVGWGQNEQFNRIAPKPVQPVAKGGGVLPGQVPAAQSDSQVLLPVLKGLVFVGSPQEVATNGLTTVGVTVRNVAVPGGTEFTQELMKKYVGHPLTRGALNQMIRDVILYYRAHDLPVVDVVVPQQNITSGTVQAVILEGRLGTVKSTGNRWTEPKNIEEAVSIPPGGEIRASELQADMDWINSNPFHNSVVVYHPGAKVGLTDLELQTVDRFPARFYAGYEDSGNANTGFDRYLVGVNWGDAFYLGQGQQLNYQYTTSGDGQSLRAHSASYIVPLPWRNTLTFFGSYTDSHGSIPPLLGITGRTSQISGRYSIPLPTLQCQDLDLTYRHTFTTGFDYKYNKNGLEFGGASVPISLYDVDQFVIGYNGALTDDYGQTTLNDQLYISPGNWGGNNNDAAFAAAHGGANSDYVYNTLTLERLTRLPYDFSLVLRGIVQTSNGNLPPSEQLGFGGYDTIRGYNQREVNADDGYIFTTELRSRPVSFGEIFKCPQFQDQLQVLGFWDTGSASNHAPLAGERSETALSSVGFGVRYSINTNFTLRYDMGYQLINTGFDLDHGSRSSLGIVVSY